MLHIRSISLLLVVLLLLLFCMPCIVHARPDSNQSTSLVELQRMLFRDKFDQADSIAGLLIKSYPDDPSGYLFASICLITRSFDAEQEYQSDLFHAYLDSAESILDQQFQTATCDSAWLYLCAGHLKAYRALWEGRFGSLLSAVKQSRSARGEYVAGIAIDSTLYDLHFGLGLYHYWKSAKAGLLRRLGLIKDDKEIGIAQLYLAADSSAISSESARSALIWIWLDVKHYDSVIVLAQRMHDEFPEGKAFLWAQGKAFMAMEQYDSAATMFETLSDYFTEHPGNYYNRIEAGYYRAICLEELGRDEQLSELRNMFSGYVDSIPKETRKRQKNKIGELGE